MKNGISLRDKHIRENEMDYGSWKLWPGVFLVFICCLFFLFENKNLGGEEVAELTVQDCIKCHPKVVGEVEKEGKRHKTEVTCQDCHQGHPPMQAKETIIPKCEECHSGTPHFELANCGGCHSNPHTPLEMKFEGKIVEACLTCHGDQGVELKEHPSAHTELGCNDCHTVHKEIPPCLRCHSPHIAEMKNEDCLACHPVHKPLVVTYGDQVPNIYCAACHDDIAAILEKNQTKHHDLTCVYCHRAKHAVIPACETCHGSPHPPEMVAKFPQCIMCHIGAHNLTK